VLRGSDESDILYASSLAAKYSKAPKNELANIHVCNIIYIGKPSGARNGMVTIDQSFTKNVVVYNPL
jgi:predicted ribosome quality control (RQC) complex YloA/Tae2 family protein